MPSGYRNIPLAALKVPEPFIITIPEVKLRELNTLLKFTKLPAPTYESLQEDGRYGISHKWLADTKAYWEDQFNWQIYTCRFL